MNFTRQPGKWLGRLAFPAFAFGLPFCAHAHLVTTGLGPVYDGIGHMLLSPEDWILIAGLGMLAGLNSPAAGRSVLFVLPGAWLSGGCAGRFIPLPLPSLAPAVALIIVGCLVAADLKTPRNFVVILAGALGFLQGYLNGESYGATDGITLVLLGASTVVFAMAALSAGLVVRIQGSRRIVVRVTGSWMAAIGILLAGWTIRKF